MTEFIEVTINKMSTVNGGKLVTINTDDIIYFEPFCRTNKTEILVNGEKRPFIVEESYDEIKDKLLAPELPFTVTTYVHDSEDDFGEEVK